MQLDKSTIEPFIVQALEKYVSLTVPALQSVLNKDFEQHDVNNENLMPIVETLAKEKLIIKTGSYVHLTPPPPVFPKKKKGCKHCGH